MIPYGRQNIDESDVQAVLEVLQSDFLTQGPKVPEFEFQIANYVGAKCAVATNSATSSLHLACLALDVGPGDVVWTSPITFVASANCARYCGADVDFVDIDPDTYNLCPSALADKLRQAEQVGRLPKVIIPVHFAGQSCDMQKIAALAKKYDIRVIEDASHAIGGRYQSEMIGDCRYSDITVFSFHPVKIITTAEGGMAVTNNHDLAEKMTLLRSHGITRDQDLMTHDADGPWYYQQLDLGFNYRMTELQAALGISQLKRLDQFISKRHRLAERYYQELKGLPFTLPMQSTNTYSSWHLYVIRLQLDSINMSHKKAFETLRENDVGVNLHYIPVHTQPYYKGLGFKWGDYPNAELYYQEAITIPLFVEMSDIELNKVVRVLSQL